MGIICIINAGSSSHRCAIFENGTQIFSAHMQWKENFKDAHLDIGEQTQIVQINTAIEGLKIIFEALPEVTVDAIGHCVVHGGELFSKLTRINHEVKEQIRSLCSLAPLHNPINLSGIELAEKYFPDVVNYALFDTAFHQTLREEVYTYPIPLYLREKGIRKYGFHGISHHYCSKQCAKLTSADRIIVCHLGAGASLCAVQGGKSVDTTMGFTPLEGLMMASRSGSIDPGLLLHLFETSTPREISDMLNKNSGLLGVSGLSEDMRDILDGANGHTGNSQLALDMFQHRLAAHIAMMSATLGGVDALVFTAGIGENSPFVRQDACERLSHLGISIDMRANSVYSKQERIISSPTSTVKVCVIPTREELEIAEQIGF